MGALVPCVDCGQPISKRAPVCLSCGREIRPTPWGLMWGGLRGIAKLMLALFIFGAVGIFVLSGVARLAPIFMAP